eukprot:c4383_g1_i1.p1 GENE.c4383_g1_i1~~c4383_g1_i1.p1  ORF type:complete len:441 (-),score=82.59 c4383_g1_i1:18-1340(-)
MSLSVTQQNQLLKEKIDQLESENALLKRTVFELSMNTSSVAFPGAQTLDLDSDGNRVYQDVRMAVKNEPSLSKNIHHTASLHYKYDLKGHEGSVYVCRFSPPGELIASGSFDKTIRLWNLERHQPQVSCLTGHDLVVADICWSLDGNRLISGSFDKTARLWDVRSSTTTDCRTLQGFVLGVVLNPSTYQIAAASDSKKNVFLFDLRVPPETSEAGAIQRFSNSSNVNCLYFYKDGHLLMCGDNDGWLKIFDTRKFDGHPITSLAVGTDRCAISSLCVSSPHTTSDDEGRYLAVNTYEDVIHLYDRGTFFGQDSASVATPKLIHSMRGHRNRSWPIRSTLFHGRNYGNRKARPPENDSGDRDILDSKSKDIHECLLLASGSADNLVYVFNIGGSDGSAELQQKLTGHTDRVYCADFHPIDPILASCSADCTIKIWTTKPKR